MHDLLAPGAELERLATGSTWSEGPVWLPERRALRWSDIPADRILEWSATTGETSVYAAPAGFANGRILDRSGNVVQCSHGGRRVEREIDGTIEPLVERWARGRFNSPNDVVVARDGSVWFTDPPYGIHPSGREGHPAEPEYGGCYVFRFDERDGSIDAVVTDMVHPNGLAFSPDESILYVAETGSLQVPGTPSAIRAYSIRDGSCVDGRAFATVSTGVTDGLRVDVAGRIWSSSADAIEVFDASGVLLDRIRVPERVANLCFGGDAGDELFIAASTSLYRIRTTTRDAAA